MSIEYHGWIVLATSQGDWGDGDFTNGYDQVAQVCESLSPDEGHEPMLPDCVLLPKVLYLKGSQVESFDLVFRIIEQVSAIFVRAYGELAVFVESNLGSCRDPSVITRYSLVGGELMHGD